MAHEDYKEMLAAHALSALDAADARALNQHLSECDECRRELADWENIAAEFALSANPAEPSRHVRERIMNAVRNENRGQRRVVSFSQSRRDKWTSLGPIGAIAAAVLFLVLIIWIIVLWQQNRMLHRQTEQLAREIQSVQEEAARSNEFVNILSSPGARIATLDGTGPAPHATARLVYEISGRAMLMANNLPPTPADKAYQLWFIVGRNPPIPGKTFETNFAGRGELSDEIPEQAMQSAVFAVTLEPLGGSLSPTSPIYLRGGL